MHRNPSLGHGWGGASAAATGAANPSDKIIRIGEDVTEVLEAVPRRASPA